MNEILYLYAEVDAAAKVPAGEQCFREEPNSGGGGGYMAESMICIMFCLYLMICDQYGYILFVLIRSWLQF